MSKIFRVGRCANFFFIITFLYGKSIEILKNSLKIDLNILRVFKKSLSRPQNSRVGRLTGNKTFSFFLPNKDLYITQHVVSP